MKLTQKIIGTFAAFALLGGLAANVEAKDLKVGDKAPEFKLKASDGKTYSLSQFRGKKAVVVAWFPKAFTGGCTKECKSMREFGGELRKLNAAYFTASVDPVGGPKGNAAFAKSLGLDYPILSDPTKATAKAYGVLSPRGFSSRVTFYIGKDGKIMRIDRKVNVSKHGLDIAKNLGSLGVAKVR